MILRGSSPAAVVLVVLWISLAAAPEAHACMCFSTPCGSITTAAHVFENVELVAPSTSRVTGTIVDPNGAPAAGVFVEIFPAPFDEWAGGVVHGASSDGEGRFVIEGLPAGRYVGGVGVPYPRPREAVAPAMARTLGGATALDVDPGPSVVVGRTEFVAGDSVVEVVLAPPR